MGHIDGRSGVMGRGGGNDLSTDPCESAINCNLQLPEVRASGDAAASSSSSSSSCTDGEGSMITTTRDWLQLD